MVNKATDLFKQYGNIEYIQADILKLSFETNVYDVVFLVSCMHHIPMEVILESVKKMLRVDGTFVVLERFEPHSIFDMLLKLILMPLYFSMLIGKCQTLRLLLEEKEVYLNHYQHDTYLPFQDIKINVKRILPEAKIRKHLFNRYSIIWTKNE